MAEHEASRAAHAHPIAAPAPEAWIKTELARHAQRPYPMDFIEALFTDFSEIHGDRAFGDDAAMSCGMAFFHGEPVLAVGNLKGRTLKERVARKFGSPDPEGYRKALRAMKIAEKFGHPIFTFIDLAGANPGIGAEERGQGEAIARNLLEMSRLRVPTIATITGEGGSGGALALAVADRVLMLENSVYSVISPEGCAAILWKDASQRERAADALKITADDLLRLKVIDEIVKEPVGGAHSDPDATGEALREALIRHVTELRKIRPEKLIRRRAEKYGAMGAYSEA